MYHEDLDAFRSGDELGPSALLPGLVLPLHSKKVENCHSAVRLVKDPRIIPKTCTQVFDSAVP